MSDGSEATNVFLDSLEERSKTDVGLSIEDSMCIAWLYLFEKKTVSELAALLKVDNEVVAQSLRTRRLGECYDILPAGPAREYVNALNAAWFLDQKPKRLFEVARVCDWAPKRSEHLLYVVLELIPMLSRNELVSLLEAISNKIAIAYDAPFKRLCIERGYIQDDSEEASDANASAAPVV